MTKNQYGFVLDCSVTMAWCFEDECNDFTDEILESLASTTAIVPSIWPLEVANVLLQAKKNKRLTELQAASFVDALSSLPIIVDSSTTDRAMHSIFILAGQSNLSIYDASYLELALREKIPLITHDKELLKAAKKLKIDLQLNSLSISPSQK